MSRTRFAKDAYALNRPGAKAFMFLPKRCRFVVVVSGESSRVIPITESGRWQIDTPKDIPTDFNVWPILVLVVPRKDAELFAKTTGEQTRQMCRQAAYPKPN